MTTRPPFGAPWRGYMAVEDLNLDTTQRHTLIAFLRILGPTAHFLSDHFNHWRTRTDGRAVIFEAQFNADRISVDAFKTRLAAVFDINPDTIDHASASHTFNTIPTPIVTFSRSGTAPLGHLPSAAGTDYIRVALFGGLTSTWLESARETITYLANNRAAWTPEDEDAP